MIEAHVVSESKDQIIRRQQQIIRRQQENEQIIRRQQQEIEQLKNKIRQESSLWHTKENSDRTNMQEKAVHMHMLETLDNILSDKDLLYQSTKMSPEQFKYLLDKFSAGIKKRSNAPLFFEDRVDPGNRCKLHKRHVLLLELMKKRTGLSQYGLMIFFGVDQSTISKYHKFANSVLAEILPTAEKITKLIQKNAPGTIKELVPDKTLIIDGSHVEIPRPTDKDARKTYYSSKKKRHSINTTLVTTPSGLILATGKSAQGSMHDITMFCEDNIKLGPLTARHEEQKNKEKRQGYNLHRSWIFRNQRRPTRCQRHAANKKIKEQKANPATKDAH